MKNLYRSISGCKARFEKPERRQGDEEKKPEEENGKTIGKRIMHGRMDCMPQTEVLPEGELSRGKMEEEKYLAK